MDHDVLVLQVKAAFPRVDWQPASLLKVLFYALPSAAGALAVNAQLQRLLSHSSNRPDVAADIHSIASTASESLSVLQQALNASPLQQALLHFSQETVLAVALPLACYLALGRRVVAVKWDWYWVKQTLATCLVLFPLVEPAVWQLWQPAVQACLGPAPPSPYVEVLQTAAAAGSWSSIAWHCLASGVVGPVWEEVFWRGFILTALIKVLPVPVCVVFSSVNFAALHLSPYNFLPLMLLSASSDCLYFRSGGNLLPSLLMHGLWNVSQVLQISLLHKDFFV
eukprot:gene7847-8044_t